MTNRQSSKPSPASRDSNETERAYRKECGHRCSVRSSVMCCVDMDDGQDGPQVWYCATCRARSPAATTFSRGAAAAARVAAAKDPPEDEAATKDSPACAAPKDPPATTDETDRKVCGHGCATSSTNLCCLDMENGHASERQTEHYCGPCRDSTLANNKSTQYSASFYRKECGHACMLTSTANCCEDEDKRPVPENGGFYETYVDGRGFVTSALRHEFYCDVCRDRAQNRAETEEAKAERRAEAKRRAEEERQAREQVREFERKLVVTTFIASANPMRANRSLGGDRSRRLLATSQRRANTSRHFASASNTRAVGRDSSASSRRPGMRATRGAEPTTAPTPAPRPAPRTSRKDCGHACMLSSTALCCADSDRRPIRPDGLYETYVDGVGFVSSAPRHEHYCDVCRERSQQSIDARGQDHSPPPAPAFTVSSSLADPASASDTVTPDIPAAPARSSTMKECGHACMLSSTNMCCADSDTRPVQPFYQNYVDGVGFVETAERHDNYCSICHDRIRHQRQEEERQGTEGANVASMPAAAVVASSGEIPQAAEAKGEGCNNETSEYRDEQLSIVTLGEELEEWLGSINSQLSDGRVALSKAQMMMMPHTALSATANIRQNTQREQEQELERQELAQHLQDSVRHLESVQRLMNTFRSAHGLADVLVSRSASAMMGGNRVADEPPMELCCSLTQEIMVDPVMTHDGQTYERAAIEGWFEQFNQTAFPTSPNTNQILVSRKLIPNYALKTLCDQHHSRCAAVRAVVRKKAPFKKET